MIKKKLPKCPNAVKNDPNTNKKSSRLANKNFKSDDHLHQVSSITQKHFYISSAAVPGVQGLIFGKDKS